MGHYYGEMADYRLTPEQYEERIREALDMIYDGELEAGLLRLRNLSGYRLTSPPHSL